MIDSPIMRILHFKRFDNSRILSVFLLSAFVIFSVTGCSQDDDQRDFEQEAFSFPEGFTETDGSGRVINEDPDDWRTAPFFQGLVFVDPAFPNPVQVSDQLMINIEISGIEAVSGLSIVVLIESGVTPELRPVYSNPQTPMPTGLTVVNISPIQLGRFGTVESARGLHRLIILDGRNNVISYGDVMVE